MGSSSWSAFAGGERSFWFGEVPGQLGRVDFPLSTYASMLLREVPADAWIATGNLGVVGYLTMNPIWDVYGLVTPVVARARGSRSAMTRDAMFRDLVSTRPAAILLYGVDRLRRGERGGSMDLLVERLIQEDAGFRSFYRRIGFGGDKQVLYLRKDIGEVDAQERLRAAASRLPEFAVQELPL